MSILTVKGLCKSYPGFTLDHAGFSLPQGTIMGFIGRNGAGKTTTLRCLLDLVHPDQGEITMFGMDFRENQLEIKQRLGFVSGGVNYYPRKKIRSITAATRCFYREWDEEAYRRYFSLFQLSEDKTPVELSEGMNVKYSLALALSHKASLLLLDEPTSGLDPVSREELLDIFLNLARQEGVSILFSTHITSDLEKCADSITYIQRGKIPFTGPLKEFLGCYQLVRFPERPRETAGLHGLKQEKEGWSALLDTGASLPSGGKAEPAGLDDIMVHLEYRDLTEKGGESL